MKTLATKKKDSFLSRVRTAFGNQGTSAATVIARIYRSEGDDAALAEALLSFPTAQRGYMLLHLRDGLAIDEAKAQVGYVDSEQTGARVMADIRAGVAKIEAAKQSGGYETERMAFVAVGMNPDTYRGGHRIYTAVGK